MLATRKTYLLDYATGVHLIGELQDMALHLTNKNLLLSLVTVLEELLDDVVAKDILHELERILLEFPEDTFLDFAICSFELLLDKSGAVLISCKFNHVTFDVGQFPSLALLLLSLEIRQLRAHGA